VEVSVTEVSEEGCFGERRSEGVSGVLGVNCQREQNQR
jgi:hypothetical protein